MAVPKAQTVPESAIALFAHESLPLAGLALLVFAVLHAESDSVHFDEVILGVNLPSDPTYIETVKYVIIYV